MIAACPKCGARYRIEDGRLPPQGARLRCARCEAVFKVVAPARSGPAPAAPGPAAAAPAAPRAQAPQPAGTPAASSSPGGALVLVADPEPASGSATVSALESWGLRTQLVHDGVEAILAIQRSLPCAVVLDAALPKMFGFQICELMKRNESLRSIAVVLVGAIHDRDRYRRPPSELYGADAYVERPRLVEQLRPILARLGVPGAEPSPTPGTARPTPTPPPPPATARPTPAPPPTFGEPPPQGREAAAQRGAAERSSEGPPQASAASAQRGAAERSSTAGAAQRGAAERSTEGLDAVEVEKAERLARIVISDIVLYNAAKFEAGIAAGNVLSALSDELEEGRGLFRQRIAGPVRDSRDFLADELIRVARQRGMK